MRSPAQKRPSVTLGTWGLPFGLRWPFRLSATDLRTHKHIMGVTGQGKSKLCALYAADLIEQGIGTAVVDPHSDLAADVLRILAHRGYFSRPGAYQKLLYIDFSRRDRFIPFNPLKQPYDTHTIARNIVEVCTRAWPNLADGAAPQFENIMLAASFVLAEHGLPFTQVTELLTSKDYREQLLTKENLDPNVIRFFHDRYDKWGRETPTMIESTLRRVFLLSFTPTLRNTIGQVENRLNLREIMDSGTSVLFNLGGLDEQTQRLLGCIITVGYEAAALSRADLPEHKRAMYQLIIDEFSMFSAQSEEALARILSLARKYGLFLTLAHQTWSQLSSKLQGAMQNTMHIVFKLGREDALWAAPHFGRFDPYRVKHEVADEQADKRTHPVYFNIQETWEGWAEKIENLWPREALLKIPAKKVFGVKRSARTIKIRTLTAQMDRCSDEALHAIQEQYANALLQPIDLPVLNLTPPTIIHSPLIPPSTQRRVKLA